MIDLKLTSSDLAKWLTMVLRASGSIGRAWVADVAIRGHESNTSRQLQLRPRYSRGAPRDAPAGLLLKVSKPERAIEGRREVEVYRRLKNLRGDLPMIVPCYEARWM